MSAPDAGELLELMDRNMVAVYAADTRATPGGEVVEERGLTMCRTPHGLIGTNMAIVTGPIRAAAVRDLTRAMYAPTESPFSVWTREHADAALEAELREIGFLEVNREPAMVFVPGAAEPGAPPPEIAIRA
ncbi:MAG TPA: hypothetical protein VKA21_10495, partial [Candidatus Binatia bacterium]|nr:hypothetical protein [Candidatus Binatia bacterium]